MLELRRQIGRLTNLNLRAEKHGDESKSGAALRITIKASNDVLSEFHPSLKSAFYRAPHPGEMDMVDEALAAEGNPDLTRLQFGSKVTAVGWTDEFVGTTTTVHYGTGGKSDIVLEDTTMDGFSFEFFDGGTVGVSLRIKCNPDEKQIGKLASLIDSEIEFSVVPAGSHNGSIE